MIVGSAFEQVKLKFKKKKKLEKIEGEAGIKVKGRLHKWLACA
jgi:hypothetical protein